MPPLAHSNFDSEFTCLPINFDDKEDGCELSRVKARASCYLERSNMLPDEVSFYSPGGNAAAFESFAEGHSKKVSMPIPLPPAATSAIPGLQSPSSAVMTPMSSEPQEEKNFRETLLHFKKMQKQYGESLKNSGAATGTPSTFAFSPVPESAPADERALATPLVEEEKVPPPFEEPVRSFTAQEVRDSVHGKRLEQTVRKMVGRPLPDNVGAPRHQRALLAPHSPFEKEESTSVHVDSSVGNETTEIMFNAAVVKKHRLGRNTLPETEPREGSGGSVLAHYKNLSGVAGARYQALRALKGGSPAIKKGFCAELLGESVSEREEDSFASLSNDKRLSLGNENRGLVSKTLTSVLEKYPYGHVERESPNGKLAEIAEEGNTRGEALQQSSCSPSKRRKIPPRNDYSPVVKRGAARASYSSFLVREPLKRPRLEKRKIDSLRDLFRDCEKQRVATAHMHSSLTHSSRVEAGGSREGSKRSPGTERPFLRKESAGVGVESAKQRGEQARNLKKRQSLGSSGERRLSYVATQSDLSGRKAYALKTLARSRASQKGLAEKSTPQRGQEFAISTALEELHLLRLYESREVASAAHPSKKVRKTKKERRPAIKKSDYLQPGKGSNNLANSIEKLEVLERLLKPEESARTEGARAEQRPAPKKEPKKKGSRAVRRPDAAAFREHSTVN